MAYPFLSLDGSGYIREPSLKVDAILASYASTQYSQTVHCERTRSSPPRPQRGTRSRSPLELARFPPCIS